MKKPLFGLSIALFMFTFWSAYSQPTQPSQPSQPTQPLQCVSLSLVEAQQYALGHNLTLANANLDLQTAQKKIWETAAAGLPQIGVSGQWQYTITPIPTIEFMPGQSASLGTRNNLVAAASLDQLIFNGSYIVGLRAAKIYRSFAELGAEKTEIEVCSVVAQSYYMALLASQTTQILKQNLELLRQTVDHMKRTYSEGFADRTAADKIEVSYNQLFAQVQSAERQIKNTRDMLKYVIGMPMDSQIVLTDKMEDIIATVPLEYLQTQSYDSDTHIDIRMAQTNVVLLEMQKQLVASEWLPSIGAKVQFQHMFIMPDFSFQRASTAYLGVGLSVPVFKSGATKAKYAQAKFALQKSKNDQTLAKQSLDLEFQQASDEFKLSWDNFQLQHQNLKLAKRVLEDTKKSLAEGVASSTDLIQSNNAFLEAVASQLQSQMNFLNAKVRMDKILSK